MEGRDGTSALPPKGQDSMSILHTSSSQQQWYRTLGSGLFSRQSTRQRAEPVLNDNRLSNTSSMVLSWTPRYLQGLYGIVYLFILDDQPTGEHTRAVPTPDRATEETSKSAYYKLLPLGGHRGTDTISGVNSILPLGRHERRLR
eukprot:6190456-Pleurochrysis_carterae.AAC.1